MNLGIYLKGALKQMEGGMDGVLALVEDIVRLK